jgi:hypothetical protein
MDRLNVLPVLHDKGAGGAPCFTRLSDVSTSNVPALGGGLSEIRELFYAFDAKKATCFRLEECGAGIEALSKCGCPLLF